MTWEAVGAIGELVGAIGVLLTLIYFGIQIRKNQEATRLSGISSAHQTELSVESKLEERAELITKANRAEELNEVENYQLERLTVLVNTDAFYKYLRVTMTRGPQDTKMIVHNFASKLVENPGLKQAWIEYEARKLSMRSHLEAEYGNQWVDDVKDELARIDT